MLVLMLPRVSSRVSGFPVVWPCLRGKLPNLSFAKVSKQVVMLFCMAGVALCDIPTCLITCRKCQNWRTPRTKCSFSYPHVSRLESLIFLWPRRVYGGSYTICPFQRFSSRLSSRFAWQTWHFVTFQPVLYRVESSLCGWRNNALHTLYSTLYTPHSTLHTLHSTLLTSHSTLHTLHFPLHTPHSTLYLRTSHSTIYTLDSSLHTTLTLHTPHFTLHTLHSTLYTLHSTSYTPHFTFCTPHFTLYTPHSTLHTLHFTLHTPHSTLYTPHSTI